MSSHAFIPDPVLDHLLRVSLQTPGIVILVTLILVGALFLYVFHFRKKRFPVGME